MEKMQKKAYKEYYFRPRVMLRKMLEIRSFEQLINYARAAMAIFKLKN